jgi:ERCC4-type nuclease
MEKLKMMKETLMAAVQSQMGNLQNANTEELGEAIDMIKDLAEAIYYCQITKAMEDSEKEKNSNGNGNG